MGLVFNLNDWIILESNIDTLWYTHISLCLIYKGVGYRLIIDGWEGFGSLRLVWLFKHGYGLMSE